MHLLLRMEYLYPISDRIKLVEPAIT